MVKMMPYEALDGYDRCCIAVVASSTKASRLQCRMLMELGMFKAIAMEERPAKEQK